MQIIEPIILTKFRAEQIGQMRPSDVIKFLILIGYSVVELKNQRIFEAAVKDLINQVNYN
jgi:hypothetical protein